RYLAELSGWLSLADCAPNQMTVDQNFLYKTVNALRVGHVLSSGTVRAFCTSYGSRLRVGATPGVVRLPLRCRNLISISPRATADAATSLHS
ncbi:MAG: hypothetical protein QOJ06_59, partial [Pseudonocardiales bacterium]|nr:hypothetical protein [Pseudonocardiales bacterium]